MFSLRNAIAIFDIFCKHCIDLSNILLLMTIWNSMKTSLWLNIIHICVYFDINRWEWIYVLNELYSELIYVCIVKGIEKQKYLRRKNLDCLIAFSFKRYCSRLVMNFRSFINIFQLICQINLLLMAILIIILY